MINKDLPANSLAAGSPAKVLKTDYPRSLNEEERLKILCDSLEEFAEYLEYEGLKVTLTKSETNIALLVSEKRKTHRLLLILENKNLEALATNNTDVIIADLPESPGLKADMTLDTHKKTRIGSSPIGEEYVKYISRLGIRFDRLD